MNKSTQQLYPTNNQTHRNKPTNTHIHTYVHMHSHTLSNQMPTNKSTQQMNVVVNDTNEQKQKCNRNQISCLATNTRLFSSIKKNQTFLFNFYIFFPILYNFVLTNRIELCPGLERNVIRLIDYLFNTYLF